MDLTARDRQAELKEARLPWALAKSFKQSCPISPFVNFQDYKWFETLTFELAVNNTIRQYGKAEDMIFNLESQIAYLKQNFPIQEGDLILTGTPEGVGPIKKGDELRAEIPNTLKMSWKVH